MGYKPEGAPTVSPYLVVEDAQAALDFIGAVFGVAPPRVFRRDDGSIMHAEARIEDSVVMIGQPIAIKPEGDRRGGVRDSNGTTWWISTAG